MRIAIVDDMIEERKLLRERIEKQLNKRSFLAELMEYESGEGFLKDAKKQPFLMVFLDIYMNGRNGIEIAQELRTFDRDCILIFTTTSMDHALEGFRVRAMQYLVKPYKEEEIASLMEEVYQRIPITEPYIELMITGSKVRIGLKDIMYAEHFPHKMVICTADGKEWMTRQTFREFVESLQGEKRFFVCSRGVIVNMEYAVDFHDSAFQMADGSRKGVSRSLIKSARQTYLDFLFQRGIG